MAPRWGQFFQCLLFHGKIGVKVHVGRLNTFMAEPQRNGGDIHASLEQMHGGRVSYDMRRNVFGGEAWTRGERAGWPVLKVIHAIA